MICRDPKRRVVVGHYDTFAILIVIKGHIPLITEKFVFTVKREMRPPDRGDIVFQQTVGYNDLFLITDDDGDTVGCYFYVSATQAKTADIPEGVNAYDLAVVNDDAGMEIELIPPSEFIAGEVVRYE